MVYLEEAKKKNMGRAWIKYFLSFALISLNVILEMCVGLFSRVILPPLVYLFEGLLLSFFLLSFLSCLRITVINIDFISFPFTLHTHKKYKLLQFFFVCVYVPAPFKYNNTICYIVAKKIR